mmetsp:Transcript_738/g.1941  ORF Transcript_738/g.1941 Transcript_738/m.1941 type:complete len:82 (+) Transcript_738:789-1034(+)
MGSSRRHLAILASGWTLMAVPVMAAVACILVSREIEARQDPQRLSLLRHLRLAPLRLGGPRLPGLHLGLLQVAMAAAVGIA